MQENYLAMLSAWSCSSHLLFDVYILDIHDYYVLCSHLRATFRVIFVDLFPYKLFHLRLSVFSTTENQADDDQCFQLPLPHPIDGDGTDGIFQIQSHYIHSRTCHECSCNHCLVTSCKIGYPGIILVLSIFGFLTIHLSWVMNWRICFCHDRIRQHSLFRYVQYI